MVSTAPEIKAGVVAFALWMFPNTCQLFLWTDIAMYSLFVVVSIAWERLGAESLQSKFVVENLQSYTQSCLHEEQTPHDIDDETAKYNGQGMHC